MGCLMIRPMRILEMGIWDQILLTCQGRVWGSFLCVSLVVIGLTSPIHWSGSFVQVFVFTQTFVCPQEQWSQLTTFQTTRSKLFIIHWHLCRRWAWSVPSPLFLPYCFILRRLKRTMPHDILPFHSALSALVGWFKKGWVSSLLPLWSEERKKGE